MMKTSEWVSLGHPDKIADYISSYLLDRYLEIDPRTRYAVEVQIKDNFVSLAGEGTSSYPMREREIAKHVRDAVCEIGYTDAYRNKWGKANAISGNDLEVAIHIGQQSPDIAKGVNLNGWGDQGIFFGMATNDPSTEFMPKDYWLAKQIGRKLFQGGIGGLDIKTQVTTENGEVARVVVAIPLQEDQSKKAVEEIVRSYVGKEADITINGTGRYVTHSSIGDAEPRTLHRRIV